MKKLMIIFIALVVAGGLFGSLVSASPGDVSNPPVNQTPPTNQSPTNNSTSNGSTMFGIVVQPENNDSVEYMLKVACNNDMIMHVVVYEKTNTSLNVMGNFTLDYGMTSVELMIDPESGTVKMLENEVQVENTEEIMVKLSVSGCNVTADVEGMGKLVSVDKVTNDWPMNMENQNMNENQNREQNENKNMNTQNNTVMNQNSTENRQNNSTQNKNSENMNNVVAPRPYPASSVFDYAFLVYIPIKGGTSEDLISELSQYETVPVSHIILKVKSDEEIEINSVKIVSSFSVGSVSTDKELPTTLSKGGVLEISFTISGASERTPFPMGFPPVMGGQNESNPIDKYMDSPEYRALMFRYMFFGKGALLFIDATVDGKEVVYYLPIEVSEMPMLPIVRFFYAIK